MIRGTRRSTALVPLALLLATAPVRAQEPVPADPAPAPEGQIDVGKLSKVPKQKTFVEAEYPAEAREKGIEADVILLLDIDAEGKVTSVGVAEPANPPGLGFDEAAMVAAQQFEFEPAEMDGKPIAVQISYRYRFKLTPKEPVPPVPAEPAPPGTTPAAPAATAPAAPPRTPVANFTGRLRERGTRLPLAGVMVTVFRDDGEKPLGFEAATDETGAFRFFDLGPGEWKILVEAPGYYPVRTTEEIRAGEATDATYYVEKASYNPLDVTVTAARPRKEVSRTVIATAELEKVPGVAGDPLRVIQNFAGVARTPLGSGQIIVRGSAPEDSRVFVDGAEVPLIYHFGGLRSVLPTGLLDSIEFYPGNFSPYYGRATGGIVDVQVKKLQPKKVGGYADVSILDSGVYLEIPLGDKGGIALAGRRSYIDFLLNATVPDDASVNLVAAPRYYDYQLVANYRPAAAHDVRAFFFGSDDRLELLFQNPAELDVAATGNQLRSSTSFYRSLLTYRYVPGERFENTFRISQGRDKVNFGVGQLVFDLDVYSSQMRDTVRAKLADSLSVNVGADVLFAKTDALVRLPRPPKEGEPVGNFDFSRTVTSQVDGKVFLSPAAFLELEWKPLPGLMVLPGVRADYFSRIDQTILQPRLTTRYEFGGQFAVKAGVGLFGQEPDFEESDDNFGNPDLEAERAIHASAGIEYRPRPHISLDATGFYKDLSNLVSRTSATVMRNGMTVPLVYDNRGSGRVYGLELVARHEFTNRFSGWLAYTLSRAERTDSGKTDARLFDFDQTHILTAIASYALPRNWQVGSRFRLVTGNPITPVVGSVFNASSDRYDPIFGRTNSSRNAAFHQLDLRVDKSWIYQGWILGVYLDVQNVYNRANAEAVSYRFDYRDSRPQQGLPILTILGVRGEF